MCYKKTILYSVLLATDRAVYVNINTFNVHFLHDKQFWCCVGSPLDYNVKSEKIFCWNIQGYRCSKLEKYCLPWILFAVIQADSSFFYDLIWRRQLIWILTRLNNTSLLWKQMCPQHRVHTRPGKYLENERKCNILFLKELLHWLNH